MIILPAGYFVPETPCIPMIMYKKVQQTTEESEHPLKKDQPLYIVQLCKYVYSRDFQAQGAGPWSKVRTPLKHKDGINNKDVYRTLITAKTMYKL